VCIPAGIAVDSVCTLYYICISTLYFYFCPFVCFVGESLGACVILVLFLHLVFVDLFPCVSAVGRGETVKHPLRSTRLLGWEGPGWAELVQRYALFFTKPSNG
jgi:hypothetical protein